MKRIQFKFIIKSFFASLLLIGLNVNVALAFPQQGDEVNAECTKLGRVPAAPYDGNNCTLCHTAGFSGGPGTGRNKYNEYFNRNIKSSLNYFCKVPPSNTAPNADAGGPYAADTGVSINFDGSGSNDADGDSLTYSWDFGDGSSGSGVSPSHSYASAGSYTVKLTVSDGTDSDSDTATAKITTPPPPNTPPTADAGGPYAANVGVSISFNGSGSNDADGDSLTYSWDFGDGASGSGVSPSHAYASAGSYTVKLTVSDGTDSDSDTATAKISTPPPPPPVNTPPTADAGGPYAADTGVSITFDGSGSNDADGDSLTYSWDFGDGASGSGVAPSHSYASAGTYTVKLTVSDGTDTGSAMSSADITDAPPPPPAANVAPVLSIIGDRTATVGTDVTIPLSATDADGDALTLSATGLAAADLVLTDNGDGTGSLTGMPLAVGNYNISVKVTDDGIPSLMDEELFTLKVEDNAPPPVRDVEIESDGVWRTWRKVLYIKGVVRAENSFYNWKTCSPLEGKIVTITNQYGKTLIRTQLNCQNRFRVWKKINRSDLTCYVRVRTLDESIEIKLRNVPDEVCDNQR